MPQVGKKKPNIWYFLHNIMYKSTSEFHNTFLIEYTQLEHTTLSQVVLVINLRGHLYKNFSKNN